MLSHSINSKTPSCL